MVGQLFCMLLACKSYSVIDLTQSFVCKGWLRDKE